MEPLCSVKEAAKLLGGLSPWTIYSWMSQGRLRRIRVGRRVMVSTRELERFVAEGNPDDALGRKDDHKDLRACRREE